MQCREAGLGKGREKMEARELIGLCKEGRRGFVRAGKDGRES